MMYLEVVTPLEKIFAGEVSDVYLPTSHGKEGMLDNHEALIASLYPGLMSYIDNQQQSYLAIGSGFVEVQPDKVVVVVSQAAQAKQVNREQTENLITQYSTELSQLNLNKQQEEITMLEDSIAYEKAKIELLQQ